VNLRLMRIMISLALAAMYAAGCGGGGSSSSGSGGSQSGSSDTITITSNATIDCLQANPMTVTLQATGNSEPLVWNVTYGALPIGLTLDSKTGTISGIPQDLGQTVVTIVAGEGKAVGTKVFTLTVYQKDAFNPINPPSAHLHAPYSLIVNGIGSTDPKFSSISIISGTMPPGLTFTPGGFTSNYLGMIAGTPTQAGTYPFTVQMKDISIPDLPQTVTVSATIIVDTHLAIVKAKLNDAVQGQTYSDAFAAVNGTSPFRWSVTGNLPAGLTLDAASGTLNGTTTGSGPYGFTVSVSDSGAPVQSDTATGNLTVVSALAVQSSISFPAYVGKSYSNPLNVIGGTPPYILSIAAGTLPPGVTIMAGYLLGTPTQLGTYNFTLKATDTGSPPQTATQALSITVMPVPLQSSSVPISPAPINELYHSQIGVIGGTPPFLWTVTSGNLPLGLTLNASTGSIDGTPTQNGTFNFVAQISDASNPVQTTAPNEFIEIRKGLGRNDSIATATPLGNSPYANNPGPFSISPYVDPLGASTANPDTDYYRLVATGGSVVHVETHADRTFPSTLLDTVIEILNASGQRLTTCTTPGFTSSCLNDDIDSTTHDSALDIKMPGAASSNVTFYVHVLDWRGDARPDMQYYLNLSGVIEPLNISPTTLGLGATRGVSYNQQFTTTGGTGAVTWSVSGGALPPGWSLNATAGLLGGTATTDGTFTFAITAKDSANPAQTTAQQFTLQIAEPVTVTSPATWPSACVNQPYSFQMTASGGIPPLTFGAALDQPVGFDLNQKTGLFNGLFRTIGTFTGRAGASDSAQPISSQSQTISIPVVNCP
jgi:hypothetical protein